MTSIIYDLNGTALFFLLRFIVFVSFGMAVGVVSAVERFSFGKIHSSILRDSGFVPAVVYSIGIASNNRSISVSTSIVNALISDPYVFTRVISLQIADSDTVTVLLKDIQFHPVTGFPIHLDFINVSVGDQVIVAVPLRVINKSLSIGVKRGGDIFLVEYSPKIKLKVSESPSEIILDIAGTQIGARFKLSDTILPSGSTMISDMLVAKLIGRRVSGQSTSDGSVTGDVKTAAAPSGSPSKKP